MEINILLNKVGDASPARAGISINKKMTYLWREEKGENYYKVQTDETEIAQKIKRRNGFRLSAIGVNCKLWIFNCEFTRPDRARRVIKSITGKKWKIDSEGVIVYE